MCASLICRPAQEMPQTLTLRRNESRSAAHPKVEDSGGFDLDASPDTEELDSRSVKTLHRLLSSRSTALVGNEVIFSVTPAQVCDCSQSCTQMAKHGLSCLFLRIARSPSCVSVRKGVCFLRTMMERST